MIKKEVYSIYLLLHKNNAVVGEVTNNIIAVYMFRKSYKRIKHLNNNNNDNDNNNVTYIPTSIQMNKTDNNSFIFGLINALKMENRDKKIGCVAIDTLSHNRKIIDFLLGNNKPILVEKHTLIMYNYICKTVLPEQVVIMN